MKVQDRFLKYVSFPTMSDEESETCPSSAKQKKLGEYLTEELLSLGLADAHMDENGYVYATLPANCEGGIPTVGLISHMDTSPEAADEPIRPKTVAYDGGDILLNEEKGITMREADYPYLADYRGQHLIVTDGTTLLGADDKAGVAEIVTAIEALIASGKKHGTVKIGFTPDEEIGRGADLFDVEKFGADYAYTVDGGALGELEYENFNAASAVAEFAGISIHPGSGKDRMKNAALYAAEFVSLLPAHEIPAETEGYEGFYHLLGIEGGIESAKVTYIIRDHDREKFEEKKRVFLAAGEKINEKYGEGTCRVTVKDSYYNMKEIIDANLYTVERAKTAMREVGIEPKVIPIRGGTDGARLSFMGLPCPNLCTGGENFHSRFEFVSVESMEKISEMLVRLLSDLAE